MVRGRKAVKTKIILATIRCMEKEGHNAVTTRSVAQEAGVNSAAINYYFGAKDHLLEETYNYLLSHFFSDLKEILEGKDFRSYSSLKVFLLFFLRGFINYPNLIRAYLFDPVISNKYGQSFIKQFYIFLERLVERIKEENPNLQERKIRISLMQIVSAISALGLPSEFFQGFSGIDLKDPETQMEYVNNLLLHYFGWIDANEITKQDEKVEQLLERIFNTQEHIQPD